MLKRTQYRVAVSHPTGFHKGTHTFTVSEWPNGSRFVDAADFGCSRDYFVKTDKEAISLLLREHACSAVSFRKLPK
jgi:hypothetical protein